jgi:signal transduction histidine kinase
VHLPRPIRTSSFRLTLLYVALFSVSVLLLFAIVAWSVTGFMAEQIDATVGNELAEVQADAGGQSTDALRQVIEGLTSRSPGIFYLLQSADGRVLAGNMLPVKPKPGLRALAWTHQPPEHHASGGIRGRGIVLPDGSYLFVGVSDYQLGEAREVILHACLLGLAAAVVLALAGGLAMSYGVLRRVESISRASRAIMAGDLGQRVPLHGTDDEFDHLSASLNAMLDRIQDLMLGLQQVSSDIAHDLRTPLTRLRQRLELARRRESTVAGLHNALDGAIGNAEAILETFGALLRIAQIEAGTRRAGFTSVALSELLAALIETYQPVAEENGQNLRGRVVPGLCVNGDRELLTQLFANLIENAIGHSPAAAEISVDATSERGEILVVVADTGPGIPAAFRRKVLQRFYRLEASRTTPGSGLGLSLVGAVATLHEAVLSLEDNEPGLRCSIRFAARNSACGPQRELRRREPFRWAGHDSA